MQPTATWGVVIDVGDVGGEAKPATSGGNAKVGKVSGDARLSTSGGDVELRGASGTVVAKTAGGDIHAELIPSGGLAVSVRNLIADDENLLGPMNEVIKVSGQRINRREIAFRAQENSLEAALANSNLEDNRPKPDSKVTSPPDRTVSVLARPLPKDVGLSKKFD
jgi:hypothetical protein